MRASFIQREGEEVGPEIPKIRCAFHSQELLTNFCGCKSCLLPLCPSCIKIHVNEHISMKTNPRLENINQLLRVIYSQLEDYGEKFNIFHKQFVQIETQIDQFREKLKNKIYSVKNDLISAVEDHFKRLEVDTLHKISQLQYVKNLIKYKELTKRTILSLKSTERNFFTEESKVMRMIIKYEANDVEKQLQNFYYDSQAFVRLHHEHFFTFSVRDNFAQMATDPLYDLLRIQIHQSKTSPQPQDITQCLRELYEKQPQKKQIKRSLYKFLSTKNTPGKTNNDFNDSSSSNIAINNDPLSDFAQMISSNKEMSMSQIRPELTELHENERKFTKQGHQKAENYAYESVKESISRASKDLNVALHRNQKIATEGENRQNNRRRSISKGKGITIMQSNTTAIEFKKSSHSILKCDMDLNFINGRSEQIPWKCR